MLYLLLKIVEAAVSSKITRWRWWNKYILVEALINIFMENNNILFDKLTEKYPFLTVCRYADEEFVGIIQNRDNAITSLYNFGALPDSDYKQLFLELGEIWWWESNRSIPINIYLRHEWVIFKPYTKTFSNKSLEILSGPCTSLNEIVHKKKKRKSITLVRRPDKD